MTALVLCLLTASPPPIAYGYTEDQKTHARTWEISDWSKAPRVWVATHAAPLRERPDGAAPVVYELPFGAPVKVLQLVAPEPVEVKGRTDRWYRVASEGHAGYLFGDALTSARFEDDFDGDGENELATVAFTADRNIRVRFFEPKEKRETFIDFGPSGGAYLGFEGGYAYPDLVKKQKAPLPLVHVDTHVQACADLADYWVSYVNGTPQIALVQSGLVDPPTVATYKVEFDAAKKRALVKRSHIEQEDKPPIVFMEVWTLDGGVFVEPPKKKQP